MRLPIIDDKYLIRTIQIRYEYSIVRVILSYEICCHALNRPSVIRSKAYSQCIHTEIIIGSRRKKRKKREHLDRSSITSDESQWLLKSVQ